jgi:signal peptidase I
MQIWKKVWSWVSPIGIAFVLTLIIGIFIVQPYKVDGHSMDPTLYDKERIYVSKLPHTFSSIPDYGDIVIIDSRIDRARSLWDDVREHPLLQLFTRDSSHIFYVKRLIGKPGDVIEILNNKVYRNGSLLDEPYLQEAMINQANSKWIIGTNHIFIMGDNRNNSSDSRVIGSIPLDHIIGKKMFATHKKLL